MLRLVHTQNHRMLGGVCVGIAGASSMSTGLYLQEHPLYLPLALPVLCLNLYSTIPALPSSCLLTTWWNDIHYSHSMWIRAYIPPIPSHAIQTPTRIYLILPSLFIGLIMLISSTHLNPITNISNWLHVVCHFTDVSSLRHQYSIHDLWSDETTPQPSLNTYSLHPQQSYDSILLPIWPQLIRNATASVTDWDQLQSTLSYAATSHCPMIILHCLQLSSS